MENEKFCRFEMRYDQNLLWKSQQKKILFLTALVYLWPLSHFTWSNFSQETKKPLFWTANLEVYLKGTYLCFQESQTIEGSFSGLFRWQGWLEPDEPDVILYHWRKEVLSWEATEKAKRGEKEMILSSFLPPPVLSVRTFLRDQDFFSLDFLIESPTLASSSIPSNFRLIMPASALRNQQIDGLHYNDYLKSGSNKVFVPVKDMAKGECRRSFSWTWSYPPAYPDQKLPGLATAHEVKVELKIKPYFENKLRS